MKRRGNLKRKFITTTLLALALVSSVKALSREEMCEPLAKFIDFYIATQQPDAPKMSVWERVIYGLAVAKTPEKLATVRTPCTG